MKMSQFKIATLMLVLSPCIVFGQVTKSKEIKKHYNVSGDGNLTIGSKYGDVHVETWDKNEVDIDITIEMTKRSEAKALQYLDKIEIVIDDASVDDLSFTTTINGSLDNSRNDRMKIVYQVKVPVSLNMNLANKYGNLYLADSRGKMTINVAYGNIKIGELDGSIDLKLSYGNGEVDRVNDGEVVARYSNLEIDDTGNLEVSNSYSNLDFGKSEEVDLINKYGNLTWEGLNNLKGTSKYGSVKIEKLYKSLVLETRYGSGVKVNWISRDFSYIDIESSYATVTLKFQPGMAASLDAELKYGDLKNYDIEFDHSYIDESGSMTTYKGKLGKGPSSGKIKISSAYGNVKMSYAK